MLPDGVDGAVGEFGALLEPGDLLGALDQPRRLHHLVGILEHRVGHRRRELALVLVWHRGARHVAHSDKPDAAARKPEIVEALADGGARRVDADDVGDHRGAPGMVQVERVADDEEGRGRERDHHIGRVRVEPVGEPIDVGVVAVAEHRIARRYDRVEAALRHLGAHGRVAARILGVGKAWKDGVGGRHSRSRVVHPRRLPPAQGRARRSRIHFRVAAAGRMPRYSDPGSCATLAAPDDERVAHT